MITTFYLIRHGETEWNRNGRWQGQADVPLSPAGRAQAEALARRLVRDGVRFDQLVASDLSRAWETAQIVARALHLPLHPLPGLREIDVGAWSGLTRNDILEQFPGYLEADRTAPGGETRSAFGARVGGVLRDLARQYAGRTIGVFTHGGTIRSMIHHVLPLFRLAHIGNTSITIVQFDGDTWQIPIFNDFTHLDGDQAPDMLAVPNEQVEGG